MWHSIAAHNVSVYEMYMTDVAIVNVSVDRVRRNYGVDQVDKCLRT